MNTTNKNDTFRSQNRLEQALDRRIASHFKIFSHIISYKTFFLVSHRNFVSVFNFFETNYW